MKKGEGRRTICVAAEKGGHHSCRSDNWQTLMAFQARILDASYKDRSMTKS